MNTARRSAGLRPKTSRIVATVGLGLTLALGATGCSMISPQATTIQYSASDGVNVPDSGPLLVRNAMIIADDSGTAGNLIAAIVNDTDSDETLNIGVAGTYLNVAVPARSVVSLGTDGTEPLLIDPLEITPGSDIQVAFQSGEGTGVELAIPVLDGTLPQYAPFVPEPETTP